MFNTDGTVSRCIWCGLELVGDRKHRCHPGIPAAGFGRAPDCAGCDMRDRELARLRAIARAARNVIGWYDDTVEHKDDQERLYTRLATLREALGE